MKEIYGGEIVVDSRVDRRANPEDSGKVFSTPEVHTLGWPNLGVSREQGP